MTADPYGNLKNLYSAMRLTHFNSLSPKTLSAYTGERRLLTLCWLDTYDKILYHGTWLD